MIVRDPPSHIQLLFILKGSIVPKIARRVLLLTVMAAVVVLIDRHLVTLPDISVAAMGIFGIALSLFLGFRNNAAYDRWWEARRLWGMLLADGRSLGRETLVFLGQGPARTALVRGFVAFAYLHNQSLRGMARQAEAADWDAAATEHAGRANPADAALRAMSEVVRTETVEGRLSDMGQKALTERLASVTLSQCGCERLAATPLPFVYSLLVLRTSYIYCLLLPFALSDTAGTFAPLVEAAAAYVFFGLSAVTDELEHPFRLGANGMPLDALCRSVEISAAEALGEVPPSPLSPVDGVLT